MFACGSQAHCPEKLLLELRLERAVGIVQVVCWGGLSGRGKRTYNGRGRWMNKMTGESIVRWRMEGNKAGEKAETN